MENSPEGFEHVPNNHAQDIEQKELMNIDEEDRFNQLLEQEQSLREQYEELVKSKGDKAAFSYRLKRFTSGYILGVAGVAGFAAGAILGERQVLGGGPLLGAAMSSGAVVSTSGILDFILQKVGVQMTNEELADVQRSLVETRQKHEQMRNDMRQLVNEALVRNGATIDEEGVLSVGDESTASAIIEMARHEMEEDIESGKKQQQLALSDELIALERKIELQRLQHVYRQGNELDDLAMNNDPEDIRSK